MSTFFIYPTIDLPKFSQLLGAFLYNIYSEVWFLSPKFVIFHKHMLCYGHITQM